MLEAGFTPDDYFMDLDSPMGMYAGVFDCKFKVALKPLRAIFFNFAKSCILTCLSLFNNKKWGSPDSFLSYKHLKAKLRVFLTGKTVAIVTSDIMKITTTC